MLSRMWGFGSPDLSKSGKTPYHQVPYSVSAMKSVQSSNRNFIDARYLDRLKFTKKNVFFDSDYKPTVGSFVVPPPPEKAPSLASSSTSFTSSDSFAAMRDRIYNNPVSVSIKDTDSFFNKALPVVGSVIKSAINEAPRIAASYFNYGSPIRHAINIASGAANSYFYSNPNTRGMYKLRRVPTFTKRGKRRFGVRKRYYATKAGSKRRPVPSSPADPFATRNKARRRSPKAYYKSGRRVYTRFGTPGRVRPKNRSDPEYNEYFTPPRTNRPHFK